MALPEFNETTYTSQLLSTLQGAIPGDIKISIISDPHYFAPSLLVNEGVAFNDYLAEDRKMIAESDAILNSALAMVEDESPDILLIPGDLTKDGEKASHEAFAAYLADLEETGTKVYVVPGNHDINNPDAVSYDGGTTTPVDSVTPEEFATIYDSFGYGEALYRDPASLSYIAAPTNDLWILALDSCEYDDNATSPETDGSLSPETVAWALEKLAEAKLQGITVLGMMHHSLAEHFSLQDDLFSDYVVDGSETLAELFADAGLQIMFTGHFHANDINTLDTESPLTEIETGSLVTWPSPVRTISLENGVLDISTASVTDIEYDTGDQTFPEYAVDFLNTGLNELAVSYLVSSFGVTEADAEQVAPYFAQAMAAHYMGDETISAETQQLIVSMASSGDQMQETLAGALQSLLTDGLPGDNDTQIVLVNPWEGMSVGDLAEVLADEYGLTAEEHYDRFHRLIITEVNSKAEGEDFFELYNYGDTAINLYGWKWIDSDADFTSADAVAFGDITLMPGETLVVVSTDAVDAETSFRDAWGLGEDVQVIVTDGKGLGGDDAVVVFDAMGNTAAALNYGTEAVTTSDGIVVDPVMLSNGTSSLGGHAGEAAGAFETTSLVWTGDSAEEPVYTYAAEGMIGGTEQQNPEDGTGSPGTATTNVATHLDTFTVGGEGAAEISAYDATTQKLFVTNAELNRIDVLDLSNPSSVTRLTSIDISAYGGNVNSVAVDGGRLAIAIEDDVKQDPGKVVVLSTDDFSELANVTVGSLPDMVTFTPDGNFILSANEGEPNADYSVDPDGAVSIIDTSDYSVTTLDFSAFNDQEEALEAEGMRVFGPGADLAADVEPEYITVSDDSATAWVTLQENNAIAEVDLASKTITAIHPLGFKDYSLEENAFDASDKDDAINITTWPVYGIYMPDSLASYTANGTTYLVTANEGDAREYDTFEEEARIEDLTLDETAFPDASTLQTDEAIGRLKVTTTLGDTDNDGDYDELYSFGARSFTIWSDEGEVVFDSGSDIETFTSILNASIFNQDEGEVDERSDAKGPEPEGLAIGEVNGTVYAFVGLERTGGVMVYDITTPESASFVQWIYTEGDVAPEGLLFIDETDTLVVSNEVSGTVSTYSIGEPDYVEEIYTLQLLHFADAEAGLLASETAPNLAALVDVFEEEYANSITLAGGDNFIPGPFLAAGTDPGVADVLEEITGISYASQGTVDIALHNIIGVEASTIGNHEFDLGSRALKDAFAYAADFPYLSANLDFSGDYDLSGLYVDTVAEEGLEGELASDLAGNIVPSAVLEEGGEKIGLVGATTQLLESISSPSGTEVIGADQNDMDLLAAQLQPVIDDLVAQGVNKIILMAHLQVIDNEIELAGKLSGVDIILAAGSNTRLGDSDDEAVAFDGHTAEFADAYPLELTDKDGNTTLLVNTDNEFTYLGRLVVDFDADGNIITDSIETNTSINGAYAATEENVAEAWNVDIEDLDTTAFAEGTRGADVAALTDAVQDVIDEKNSNVFGYTDVYLEGERALVRSEETNLGDLSADANAYAAELAMGTEAASSTYIVSLKNGGGIRAQIGTVSAPDPVDGTTEQLPPDDGAVTQLDVENSLRFDNQLMMFDTTPEGLKAILEHGVAEGTLQGRFPQVGGISFSWDPDFEAGARVSDIALVGDDYIIPLYDDGVLLDTAPETISMVTLSFLAEGGDGYPMKEYGENFRYIIDNGDGTVSLSEAIDESLDFTVADNVPGGETPLGEQAAFEAYMEEFHATVDTAYDEADTPASEDTRIQNLNEREEAVLPEEKLVLLGYLELPGAEITAYDASTSTAYVIGGDDKLYVVDISNPTNPELKETLTLAGNAQSVAVNSDGLIAVAVDREATVDGSTATYHADGLVQFFTTVDGVIEAAGQVTVGSLPDSLAFNEDGTIIVTANEGEPNMFYGMGEDSMDPEGSISVIEVNAVEPSASTVTTLGFDAYNDFLVQLQNKGVRISGDDAADGIEGNLVAQDIEPEYVTITGDKAYVSLQENNAIAVVDLVAKEITDIFPVGLKDWSRGIPEATEYAFSITYPGDRPDADGDGVVDDGEVVAGGLSGLWYDGVEEVDGVAYEIYYTITDRGPQAFNIGDREGDNPEDPALGEKVFEDPYYPITIYKLGKDSDGNVVELGSTTLQVPDASGEGFRDATGLGMLDRNDAAYAPVEKIAEHYFLTPIDGKIPATDSASAITAIITGEKTDAGNISWASGDADGGELETIAETLRDDLGFAIGVASTVPFSHATPAGVVSHDVNRGNKWDIAHEILFDTAPDVVIGGGYENSYFATTTTNAAGEDKDLDDNGYNDDYDAFVNGTDGTDYVFVERAEGVDGGQALLDAAATVDLSAGDKLFGLFGTSGGNFEYFDVADQPGDPEVTRDIEDPTLADITTATLSVLNQDEDGFFVMFEQGDIDWNNHANDYENMIGGVYDLDQAVLTAEAYVDAGIDGISWENTLVIVTSDHSNSYLRSEEVLGLGNLPTQEGTPYSFTYPDGEVTYSTTGHTNELVTVAARGAGAELFEEYAGLWYDGANIVDNTQIYDVMKAAAEEAGVEHIMLFIGDGMNVEHEVAASRYLYGEDQALAWDSWGSIEEGWSGYATTWDIDTYNLYASAAGEEAYDAENFDPVIGYDPALGGTTPYPVASDDPAVQEFLDENSYALLGKDQFGLDAEAVLRLEIDGLNDGNAVFAVADEYGPQIAIFDAATGELIHRMVPENTEFEAATNISYADNPDYTLETLPEVYSSITNNRGFEAMAYNSDDGLLYAFIQSPLRPDGYLNTEVTRIVAVNPVTGEAVHEYLYSLTGEPGQDKIGDAVYDTARGVFYVIERDSATTSDANKSVFEINLAGATDVLEYTTGANGKSWEDLLGDGVDQPELSDVASLADALAGVVQFVYKNELLNIPSLGIDPSFDKAEGLALKEDGTLVVTFDNDFVHDEDRDTDNMLVEITFNDLLVDTSDNEGGEEDVINPGIRDFYGMRMPDGIDSYEYNGDTFIVMANEGDGRVRPDSVNFEVDDEYDGAWLKLVSELEGGEDVVDTITDPLTGEEIHIIVSDESDDDAKEVEAGDEFFLTMKYGWASDDDFYTDETRLYKYDDDNDTLSDEEEDKESDIGRLKTVNTEVYLTEDAADAESPDQIIAFGGRSISIMDSNGNIVYDSGDLIEQAAIAAGVYDDGRSDDKGTEPESIALANVNGKTIAYVALERVNSLAVFDVTNPYNVSFIELVDIAADTGLEAPEGLVADDGLLIVSNEETTGLAVYGTVSSAYNSGDDNESYVMYREQGNIYMGDKVKANHITGGSLNDSITGGSGNDSLYGGDGDDYIYAESGDDYVEAGAGDDIIVGGNGEGDDTYDGGAGSDTVIYTSAEDDITVDLALGFATSTNGEDAANIGNDILIDIQNILTGDYDDTLIGNDDDNRIEAGKGDDTITGGGGNDSIIGGEGIDTVMFSGEREEYAISYDEQIDTFTIIHKEDGADGTDTLTGIENLSFVDEMALNAEDFTSSILDAAQASSSGSSDDSSAILIGLGVIGFFALVL